MRLNQRCRKYIHHHSSQRSKEHRNSEGTLQGGLLPLSELRGLKNLQIKIKPIANEFSLDLLQGKSSCLDKMTLQHL